MFKVWQKTVKGGLPLEPWMTAAKIGSTAASSYQPPDVVGELTTWTTAKAFLEPLHLGMDKQSLSGTTTQDP